MKPLRVGVDLLFVQPRRNAGCESYIRELLHEFSFCSSVDCYLFTNQSNHYSFDGYARSWRRICLVHGRNRLSRVLYQQFKLSSVALRERCDVLFCPGYLSPMRPLLPTVVTIHDTQFYDLRQMPWLQRLAYRSIIPRAAPRASAILTISEFSKSRILHHLKVSANKIHVTLLAGKRWPPNVTNRPPAEILQKYDITPPYVLSLSSVFAHKNFSGLIEGFQRFKQSDSQKTQLVIIGQVFPRQLTRVPEEVAASVRLTGYVPDEELAIIFAQASGFILASLYEGFGLPILEAMSFGLPVACSHAGSLPEVGGEAALYFDPQSPPSIALALEKLLSDHQIRHRLIEAASKNLKRFSWRRCAEETLQVLAGARQGQ